MLPACVSHHPLIELHQDIKSEILSGHIKWALYCRMSDAVEDEDVEMEQGFSAGVRNTRQGRRRW